MRVFHLEPYSVRSGKIETLVSLYSHALLITGREQLIQTRLIRSST